jgi:calreticulin
VDEERIIDESHKKPECYDQIPWTISDPEANLPEDWEMEADGEWEAPEVDNPDFKEWEPKMIANPAYKGEWKT